MIRLVNVVEIFASIQGEGTRAGEPTVFIRLAGCLVRCAWCDTPYAFQPGVRMSLQQVLETASRYGVQAACVTGGEPMGQKETPALLASLERAGYDVTLMTSGHFSLARVPESVRKVVDIKTPWAHLEQAPSGVAPDEAPPHLHPDTLGCLTRHDEAKFTIRGRAEFDWAVRFADREGLWSRVGAVLIGPVWRALDPAVLADWVLESRRPIRLNLQWHKVLWGDDTRR